MTPYGNLTVDVSVTDVEPVKKILEAVSDMGTKMPDGHFCTCQMQIGNPMLKSHTSICRKINKAIKQLKK